MNRPDDVSTLKLHSRPTTTLNVRIPTDVVATLQRTAARRDMEIDALVKLYIGQGLRQDLSNAFANHVLELTAQVLTKHGQSQEQVDAILREIRGATGT